MSGGGGAEQKPGPIENAVAGQLTNNLFPAAEGFFNTGTEGIFQGSRLGAEGDVTQMSREQLLQLIPQLQQGGVDSFNNISSLTSFDPNDPINQQLIDAIGQQSGEQFNRNILPGINNQATAAGQFGSSRQGIAQGVAAGDAAQSLQNQIAGVFERQRDRAINAGSILPGLQRAAFVPGQVQGAIGADIDARTQAELNDQIQQEEAGRNAELRRLQEFQNLLGFSGPQAFSSEVTSGKAGHLQGALGGAATGAGIGFAVGGPVGAGIGAGVGAGVGFLTTT